MTCMLEVIYHNYTDRRIDMDEDENYESICSYIARHNTEDPAVQELFRDWVNGCNTLDIDLHYVRCKLDGWYREVYLARRNNLQEWMMEALTSRSYTKKDLLYQQFLATFEDLVNSEVDSLHKLPMISAMARIKAKYNDCPSDWVDLAVSCIEREDRLMNRHIKKCLQSALEQRREQADQKVEGNIDDAKQLRKRIFEDIEVLHINVLAWQDLLSNQQVNQVHFSDIQIVGSALSRRNETVPDQQYLETVIQKNSVDINGAIEQVTVQHQKLVQMFQETHAILDKLVNDLQEKVQEWRRQFRLDYAELAASPNLQRLAPGCASTGRILYDLLHVNLECWQNILSNIPVENNAQMLMTDCETQQHAFQGMMKRFLQSTFVVTEQGNFFIKKGNKQFPKITVRILAADLFYEHSEDITAHFVSEDDLKTCCRDGDLDLRTMKAAEKRLTTSKLKLTTVKGKDKMECCFEKLQFESSFRRSQSSKELNRQVHEEKYRVIFITTIESSQIWTMSLPLVVTTASNQEAHSLASIMWQCYSTDVFNPTVGIPEQLPWITVADMLQTKMFRLSTMHGLSDENITHLKNRLFGEEKPDDTPVTLTQFCWNHMLDTEFSFWRWFLGIYNLIDQYLRKFWTKGLIMGFVKKEDAERMLKTCDKAGTFILRFSDKYYTNRDGLKSVYGRLMSCVLVLKEIKGSKRQSLGQPKPVKINVIEHVDVADFKKLGGEVKKIENVDCPRNNLADILKETWIKGRDSKNRVQMYCHLYPGDQTREELFDKYCEKDVCTPMPGYRRTTEAYVACLEQAMMEVNLDTQSTSSKYVDIDSSSKLGSAKVKNSRQCPQRANKSPRHSTSCQSNISTPQGSPLPVQSPINPNQSPVNPNQSPMYPNQSPMNPNQSPMNPNQSPMYHNESPRNNNTPAMSPAYPAHIYSNVSMGGANMSVGVSRPIGGESMSVGGANVSMGGAISSVGGSTLSVGGDNVSVRANIGVSTSVGGVNFLEGGVSFDQSLTLSSQIAAQTDGKLVPNIIRTQEETQTTAFSSNSLLSPEKMEIRALSRLLTPDKFQLLLSWLPYDQVAMEIDVQAVPVTQSSNAPVYTSSGSSGESLGYSAKQLAAMGSGDIDADWLNNDAELDISMENSAPNNLP